MIDKLRDIGAELGLVKSKVELENEERLERAKKEQKEFWKEHTKLRVELFQNPKSVKKDRDELPKEIDVSLLLGSKKDTPEQQRAREKRVHQRNIQMLEDKLKEEEIPEDIPFSDTERNSSYVQASSSRQQKEQERRHSSYVQTSSTTSQEQTRRYSTIVPHVNPTYVLRNTNEIQTQDTIQRKPRRRTEVVSSPFVRTGGDLQRLYNNYYSLFYGK